jgi:hypothetical protein
VTEEQFDPGHEIERPGSGLARPSVGGDSRESRADILIYILSAAILR